jgi:hypothetical protein
MDMEGGSSSAGLNIGDIVAAGDSHEGFIYGGIPPGDTRPIWVSQFAPTLMNHFNAVAWAWAQDGGRLPAWPEAVYLETIKDKGAFKELFHSHISIWLEHKGTPYYLANPDFSNDTPLTVLTAGSHCSATAIRSTVIAISSSRSCLSGDELLSELTINNTRADTSGNGREAGTLNKRRKTDHDPPKTQTRLEFSL